MTIQIRQAVFETNSSSSHSLTMGKGNLVKIPFSKEILRAGEVQISLGNYGWEWYRYYSPLEKLRYLMTHLLTEVPNGDSMVDVTARLREDHANVDLLCQVVKEYTGCDVVLQPGDRSLDSYAYNKFDHLLGNGEALKKFIFDEASFVQTGNDNSAMPWTIRTDREDTELAYGPHIRAVPSSYRPVKLTPLEIDWCYRNEGLATADGGVVAERMNKELFAQVLAKGVVTHIRYHVHGPRNPSEGEGDMRGRLLKSVLLPLGLKVAESFSLDFEYEKVGRLADPARKKEELEIVIALPPAVSKALRELPISNHAKFNQLKAREDVRFWKKRLKDAERKKEDKAHEVEHLGKARAHLEQCNKEMAKAQRREARLQKAGA